MLKTETNLESEVDKAVKEASDLFAQYLKKYFKNKFNFSVEFRLKTILNAEPATISYTRVSSHPLQIEGNLACDNLVNKIRNIYQQHGINQVCISIEYEVRPIW